MTVERRVGEQVLQVPAQAGERAGHRAVDPLGGQGAVGAEIHEPHALAVVGLREGVRQRGSRVAHALGDDLAAVQVPEGGVVDSVEDSGGHGGDAADGDVPLAVAHLTAGDEGMGEDDGAGARRTAA